MIPLGLKPALVVLWYRIPRQNHQVIQTFSTLINSNNFSCMQNVMHIRYPIYMIPNTIPMYYINYLLQKYIPWTNQELLREGGFELCISRSHVFPNNTFMTIRLTSISAHWQVVSDLSNHCRIDFSHWNCWLLLYNTFSKLLTYSLRHTFQNNFEFPNNFFWEQSPNIVTT